MVYILIDKKYPQELQFTLAVVCRMVEESLVQMRKECEEAEQKLGCLTEVKLSANFNSTFKMIIQNLDIVEDLIYSAEDIGIRIEDFEDQYLCIKR